MIICNTVQFNGKDIIYRFSDTLSAELHKRLKRLTAK